MVPDSAIPVQQGITIIEIRPYRNGWQCFEAPGVKPYWVGKSAKQDVISYATARAKFGTCEIRLLNKAGGVVETLRFDAERQVFPHGLQRRGYSLPN